MRQSLANYYKKQENDAITGKLIQKHENDAITGKLLQKTRK